MCSLLGEFYCMKKKRNLNSTKLNFFYCSCVMIWLIVYTICGRWCEVGNIVNLFWEVENMTSCLSNFRVFQESTGNLFTFLIPIQWKISHKYSLKCHSFFSNACNDLFLNRASNKPITFGY